MTALEDSRFQVDNVTGTLTITNLRIPDSNTYHCTATNYIGSDTSVTTVTVQGMYVCMSVHIMLKVLPNVIGCIK